MLAIIIADGEQVSHLSDCSNEWDHFCGHGEFLTLLTWKWNNSPDQGTAYQVVMIEFNIAALLS